jgi:hypothetical protein
MMWSRRLAFVVGCALLASCGGDDGGGSPPATGGGGGGTPTPSPSPSPSPSPTPTPTYMTFAELTGTQTFATTCGGTFNGGQRQYIGGEPLGGQSSVTIVSDRSQPTYQLSAGPNGAFPGFNTTFTQADRDPAATGEAYRKTTGTGFTERLSIISLTSGGTPLPYIRVASFVASTIAGSTTQTCVFGVPTIVSDRPASTVTYNNLATFGSADITRSSPTGPVTENYRINSSTYTMTANPTNGQLNFTLTLRGQLVTNGQVSPTVTDLGVFTGTATLDGTTPSFVDILVNDRNTVSGTFGGGFFGPQGRTAGLSVSIRSTNADGSDLFLGALLILVPPAA